MTKENSNLEVKFQDLLLGEENVGKFILTNALLVINTSVLGNEGLPHAFMNKVCQVEVLGYLLQKEKPELEDVINFIKKQTYESFINMLCDVDSLYEINADFIGKTKKIENLFDEMEKFDDEFDDYEDLGNNCPL